MDRLDAMRVFTVAIDEGSLAGAARALQRSPAAVSRAISFLEAHLGSPLLHRTTRAMRPSPVGERYSATCRRVLADLDEAASLAAGEGATPQGVLTLSAPAVCGEEILQPIVNGFLGAYPAVAVRLLLLDRLVNLVEEGVDLALRIGNLPDSAQVAVKVGSGIRRVVVAAPRYLDQHPPIDEPHDLVGHQIIALAALGADSWTFPPAPGSPAARVAPFTARITVNSARAALASAAQGLGLTRVDACDLAQWQRGGELRIVLADAEPSPQPVHLVAPAARLQAPKVRAFVDYAVPRLRDAFGRVADGP
jgi:DNA-binding transcriptional LysR family regulator